MAAYIKTVTVVGANGNLGSPILKALLESNAFTVSVLARDSSTSSFPSQVAAVHKVDFDNQDALVQVLKGQDAVVSCLPFAAMEDQPKLIDAAAKAGVKRFIPSEFGSDSQSKEGLRIVPFFESKVTAIDHLKTKESSGLTWTTVINGPFFDWGLKVGFLDVDFKNRNIPLYDIDDPASASFSTLSKIAIAVVKILQNPAATVNKYIYIASFTLSRLELKAALERVTKEKWTTTEKSSYELEKSGKERFANGDQSGLISIVQTLIFRNGIGSDYAIHEDTNDNELLGLPEENLDSVLADIISRLE